MPQPIVDFLYRHRFNKLLRVARAVAAAGLGDTKEGIPVTRGPLAGYKLAFSDSMAMWIGGHETAVTAKIIECLGAGQVAFDIGAHVGFTVLLMAKQVGPSGRVIGYEPDPANRELLEHNIRINGLGSFVEARGVAVGRECGVGDLRRGDLSILTQVEAGPGGSVEISTLDEEVFGGKVPIPELIVVDAEGAEEDIFRGGWRLLSEHSPRIIAEDHGRRDQLIALLAPIGYVPHHIDHDHVLFEKTQ